VRRYFGDKVFNTLVPRSVRLAEAPSYGQPISVYAPASSAAHAYAALAQEVLAGDGFPIPDSTAISDGLPTPALERRS
jgi:chromosome partitioning protein